LVSPPSFLRPPGFLAPYPNLVRSLGGFSHRLSPPLSRCLVNLLTLCPLLNRPSFFCFVFPRKQSPPLSTFTVTRANSTPPLPFDFPFPPPPPSRTRRAKRLTQLVFPSVVFSLPPAFRLSLLRPTLLILLSQHLPSVPAFFSSDEDYAAPVASATFAPSVFEWSVDYDMFASAMAYDVCRVGSWLRKLHSPPPSFRSG